MRNLNDAVEQEKYVIQSIETDDEEIKDFLFTLGCYAGEAITVISKKKNNIVISLKDARYNIDSNLASTIKI